MPESNFHERSYTLSEATQLGIGITYPLTAKWLREGLLQTSFPSEGRGAERRLTYLELLALALAHGLRRNGASMERVASTVGFITASNPLGLAAQVQSDRDQKKARRFLAVSEQESKILSRNELVGLLDTDPTLFATLTLVDLYNSINELEKAIARTNAGRPIRQEVAKA